jgi:mRNA-degrading endonuclease toxin of MazEF toxin-antitoxin module
VDQEQWQQLDTQEKQQKPTGRKGGNLPHRARPGNRARNQKDQARANRSERRFEPVQRDYHGGANHTHRAVAVVHCPRALESGASTGLTVPSVAVFNQIRAVDRRRLIRKLGKAEILVMAQADHAIQVAFGLASGD